jgi:hypothetical protein
MAANPYRSGINDLAHGMRMNRGLAFGAIIITALLAFEIFNYSTTDYALSDLLGELEFAGLRWATILAIAFCGIDFAGIARLFTPEAGQGHNENWFLFGAWLLAATMNAMLTWWGVSLAILGHQTAGSAVVTPETMIRVGPVFVAVLVWLIRVLIIGTFSVAGDRLFNLNAETTPKAARPIARPSGRPQPTGTSEIASGQQRPAGVRPRPSQPLLNEATPVDRPTSTRRPTSRLNSLPLEPEYEDDENSDYSDNGYSNPGLSRAPLAARSTRQATPNNPPPAQESSSYRVPIPPRRKS